MADDIREYVIRCFEDILYREPEYAALNYFVEKIKNQEFSKEIVPIRLKGLEEYKQIMKNNGKFLIQIFFRKTAKPLLF